MEIEDLVRRLELLVGAKEPADLMGPEREYLDDGDEPRKG